MEAKGTASTEERNGDFSFISWRLYNDLVAYTERKRERESEREREGGEGEGDVEGEGEGEGEGLYYKLFPYTVLNKYQVVLRPVRRPNGHHPLQAKHVKRLLLKTKTICPRVVV